jgi:catechol 2,3-dioxygenase-like lactoylglutathione lyase family enzyme
LLEEWGMIQLSHLDHLVLTGRDVDAGCRFYAEVLGMEVVTFAGGRKALRFGRQKINLHQLGREFEPKAAAPTAGSADLCFSTGQPLAAVVARLAACQVPVIDGPLPRTGATAPIRSIYCREPDDNLIEIANLLSAASSHPQRRCWRRRSQVRPAF